MRVFLLISGYMKKFLLGLLLLLFSVSIFASEAVLYTQMDFNLDLFEREEAIQKVRNNPGGFVTLDQLEIDEQKDEATYWFFIEAENDRSVSVTKYLQLRKGYFWKAYLFELDRNWELQSEHSYNVLNNDFDLNALLPSVNFPVSFAADEKKILLIRVKAYDIKRVLVSLTDSAQYEKSIIVHLFILGALIGILLGLFVYNLALLLSIREIWLLFFVISLVTAAFYILTTNRVANLFQNADDLFANLTVIAAILFSRQLVLLKNRAGFLDKIFLIIVSGLVIEIIMIPFGGVLFLSDLFSILMISSAIALSAAGVVMAVERTSVSVSFFAASIVFSAGIILSVLANFGVHYGVMDFYLKNMEQPGFIISLMLFSMIVSGRIRAIRDEKFKTEQRIADREAEHLRRMDFVATVSHELRTPLTNLQLPLEKILSQNPENKISAGDPVFSRLFRQVRRLSRQVERLLSLKDDSIQHYIYQPLKTDLSQVCTSIVEEFRPAAERKNLLISCEYREDETHDFQIDQQMLETAVINLIDNAIKFTDEGFIKIILEKNVDSFSLKVMDTGRGISPERIGKTRSRYYSYGADDGYGIGLAQSDEIIQAMSGKMVIESEEDRGTTVELIFPVRVSCLSESFIKDGNASHLLVVEDDSDMLSSICDLLKDKYNITTAVNGEKALSVMKEMKPDLIISDVMMPLTDGFEFLKEVRSSEDFPEIPFIFLTAMSSHEQVLDGLRSGAVDYIRKPFNGEELTEKIGAILRSRSDFIKGYDERFREYLNEWNPLRKTKKIIASEESLSLLKQADDLNLTTKQKTVLDLVCKGYTDKEIADILKLSVKTVNKHVSSILKKTGVQRRTQLSYELHQEGVKQLK